MKARPAKPKAATKARKAKPVPRAAPRAGASAAAKARHEARHAGKAHDPRLVERLRRIALSFPEAVEVEQFGEPWFKAGRKAFCSYGAEGGRDGAAFNVTLVEQAELLRDPRFERTRHVGQHGWTTMRWDGPVDWDEVAQLVEDAYRKVANRRQLALLDAR